MLEPSEVLTQLDLINHQPYEYMIGCYNFIGTALEISNKIREIMSSLNDAETMFVKSGAIDLQVQQNVYMLKHNATAMNTRHIKQRSHEWMRRRQ